MINNKYIPLRLEARDSVGAGWEIYADIPERISCIEYAMKPGWKPILKAKKMIAYAPWVGPFAPKEWEQMVGEVIKEMVRLWNERQAIDNPSPSHASIFKNGIIN